MEILSIIAITLSGLTLTGLLADKIIAQFKQETPDAQLTVKSSCCNKDNHSKRNNKNSHVHESS